MKIFISYSHQDEETLNRLHTHLYSLKREGAIQTWYDREIRLGQNIDSLIEQEINEADIFIAVVSADFIASDYCYEREMDRALKRYSEGKMIVIPVIAEPCDWQKTPLGKLMAAPKDGKAISEWKNKNNAYLDIVMNIRRLVSGNTTELQANLTHKPLTGDRTLKYKVKKDFNEIEIAEFREYAFNKIFQYFEESINEINEIEGVKGRITRVDTYSFTCSVLNMSLSRGAAHITVHAGTNDGFMGDIYYSNNENAPKNTSNGGFRIKSDEYDLFLSGSSFMQYREERKLNPDEAAEQLWNEFLEQAGISCAA